MTNVGAVVLTFDGEPAYESLVGTLRGDVVIVHNPGRMALAAAGSRTVIEMPTNGGYAGGMNAGIRRLLEGRSTHVLMLTHDVRFEAGGLEALLRAADTDYGIVGPVIRWDAKTMCYGGEVAPDGRAMLRTRRPALATGGVADCAWVDGCAILLRREVLEQVGLFDESFFMYFEEIDLCLRAARVGWKTGVVVEAVAEQDHGYLRRPELYSYLMTRNGLELARRVAGWRGVLGGLGRAVAGQTSAPTPRRLILRRVLATGRGVAAFGARRFGPPPAAYLAVTGK